MLKKTSCILVLPLMATAVLACVAGVNGEKACGGGEGFVTFGPLNCGFEDSIVRHQKCADVTSGADTCSVTNNGGQLSVLRTYNTCVYPQTGVSAESPKPQPVGSCSRNTVNTSGTCTNAI